MALDGKFTGVGTLALSNLPGWGLKKRASAPSAVGPLLQALLTKTNFAVKSTYKTLDSIDL